MGAVFQGSARTSEVYIELVDSRNRDAVIARAFTNKVEVNDLRSNRGQLVPNREADHQRGPRPVKGQSGHSPEGGYSFSISHQLSGLTNMTTSPGSAVALVLPQVFFITMPSCKTRLVGMSVNSEPRIAPYVGLTQHIANVDPK